MDRKAMALRAAPRRLSLSEVKGRVGHAGVRGERALHPRDSGPVGHEAAMSTYDAKRDARARRGFALGAVGPLEFLAAGVAQAHGLFVASAATLGLVGFPCRFVPWLAASWAGLAAASIGASCAASCQARHAHR
jgi:hypothetical protein